MGKHFQSSFMSLGHFCPRLICEYFSKFPADLAKAGITLPDRPTEENVPWDALTSLLTKTQEFADPMLPHSARMIFSMRSEASRAALRKELRLWGKKLKWSSAYTGLDTPLACWLQHPEVLEKAFGREATLMKRSFAFYPAATASSTLVIPTDESVKSFSAGLEQTLVDAHKVGYGLWIVPYVEKDFIHFLLRYGESTTRKGVVLRDRKSGTVAYNAEEFKSVIYDRMHGDLRVYAPEKVRDTLRMKFGQLLFGDLFHFVDRQVFFIDHLADGSLKHVHCGDVKGIESVSVRGLTYTTFAAGEAEHHIKARDGQCLLRTQKMSVLFPALAFSISQLEYHIKLPNRRDRRPLVISSGNEAQFALDAHSKNIEKFLRARNVLRTAPLKHDQAA